MLYAASLIGERKREDYQRILCNRKFLCKEILQMLSDGFEFLMCVGFIAVIWFYFSYRPKQKKRSAEQEEEKRRQAEQLTRQQNYNKAIVKIKQEMEQGYTLRQCSKIIDAYSQMNKDELFKMMENILVAIPEPHDILNTQGHKIASDKPIEVIYDDWHLRGLLKGTGPFDTSDVFDEIKVYHGIPQYLADNYGVPQVLIDEKVSVTLEELKIKWSVSIDPAVGLYGLYDNVGFIERFEIFRDLLKSRYPNMGNLSVIFLH